MILLPKSTLFLFSILFLITILLPHIYSFTPLNTTNDSQPPFNLQSSIRSQKYSKTLDYAETLYHHKFPQQQSIYEQQQLLSLQQQNGDPTPPPSPPIVSTIQGFWSSQTPVEGFPIYMASINFNRPSINNETFDRIPAKYLFSFSIADIIDEPELPLWTSLEVQIFQIYPKYVQLVVDTISNTNPKRPIKLETNAFMLHNTTIGESYRANIFVHFDPKQMIRPIESNDIHSISFTIKPTQRHHDDPYEPDKNFAIGNLIIHTRSIQSDSNFQMVGSSIQYPPISRRDTTIPEIYKAQSKLKIPFNQHTDQFSKFELWATFQPDIDDDPLPGLEFFNGWASTISVTLMGEVNSFVKIYDDDINYTFDGCFINSIRIPEEQIEYYGQTIYFGIGENEYELIYRYSPDSIHIECHSLYYILSPKYIESSPDFDYGSYVQLERTFTSTDGIDHHNPKWNDLTAELQDTILSGWAQLIPISRTQLFLEIPLPFAQPYPLFTEWLSIYRTDPPIPVPTPPKEQEENKQQQLLLQFKNDENDNYNNNNDDDVDNEITPLFSILNNDVKKPHPDQLKNQYLPNLDEKSTPFDDDNQDPAVTPLLPSIQLPSPIQFFHLHRRTPMSEEYQLMAIYGGFQFTLPTLINPLQPSLVDERGDYQYQVQFLKHLDEQGTKLRPRLRIFVPYLHTHINEDIEDVFRALFVTIACVQTGYQWGGQVSWDSLYMGYSNWVDLDYESILYPPELVENGLLNKTTFYINNPPIIEVTYNTYGGQIRFPKLPTGLPDLTGHPQQSVLEIQHVVPKYYINNDPPTTNSFQTTTSTTQFETTPIISPTATFIQQQCQEQSQKPLFQSHHRTAKSNNSINNNINNNDFTTKSNNDFSIQQTAPVVDDNYALKSLHVIQPVPYNDLRHYSTNYIEFVAFSSTIPHFKIINHKGENIQGIAISLWGTFTFPPSIDLESIELICGYDVNPNNKRRCYAKEIKLKPNLLYILLKTPTRYNIELKVSTQPYFWYKRGLFPQYPREPKMLYQVISLQVQYNLGTNNKTNEDILQPLQLLMNQTVTLSFPYGDNLAPRTSRGARPFEWTLNAETAFIVALISLGLCALFFFGLAGLGIYYYIESKRISRSENEDGDDGSWLWRDPNEKKKNKKCKNDKTNNDDDNGNDTTLLSSSTQQQQPHSINASPSSDQIIVMDGNNQLHQYSFDRTTNSYSNDEII